MLTSLQIEMLRKSLYEHADLPQWPDVDALCDMAARYAWVLDKAESGDDGIYVLQALLRTPAAQVGGVTRHYQSLDDAIRAAMKEPKAT